MGPTAPAKLSPWNPQPKRTLWLDFHSGTGVNHGSQPIKPILSGRRKHPRLTDLPNTARHHQAERIMLTGKIPSIEAGKPHWLVVETEGWRHGGHWPNRLA